MIEGCTNSEELVRVLPWPPEDDVVLKSSARAPVEDQDQRQITPGYTPSGVSSFTTKVRR